MQYFYKSFPTYPERRVSICDAQIYKVRCEDEKVSFFFRNCFFIDEETHWMKADQGCLEFLCCNANEFSCHIIKRTPSKEGDVLHGEPISLVDLGNLLDNENRNIEIFLEMYDFYNMYWRGALLPYNCTGLSDRIDIELSGQFAMRYSLGQGDGSLVSSEDTESVD